MKFLDTLKILVYELEWDELAHRSITLDCVPGMNCERWAIRDGGFALGKTKDNGVFLFSLETSPSSRDADYYQEFRWPTAQDALSFWNKNRSRIVATMLEKQAWCRTVSEDNL